jgi:hypothetical protein
MVSPWPPSTKAWVFSTETSSSMAMKARKRAESRTPAMPMTRCLGSPLASKATWHMASSGLLTMMRRPAGERRDLAGHAFNDAGVGGQQVVAAHARFAGDAGGDDDDVGAGRGIVVVWPRSNGRRAFSMGAAWARSRALPCGTPSMMSTSTTSQSSFSASRWAAVAPTLPAPIP